MRTFTKAYLQILLLVILLLYSFSSGQINLRISSLKEIKNIGISYQQPNFDHPSIIVFKDSSCNSVLETINAHNLVKFSPINDDVLKTNWEREFKKSGREFKLITKFNSDLVVLDSLIVSLFAERYNDYFIGNFDLVIWEKTTQGIIPRVIYPESFVSNFFSIPHIVFHNRDTLKIGDEFENEGSINGSFKYLKVMIDSVQFFRKEVVHGHAPFGSESNPIKGAITKRYLNIFYDDKGNKIEAPITYNCVNETGNTIFGEVIGDSLSLHKLYWGGIGDLIKRCSPKLRKIKVGEIVYKYGDPFIAVEYEGTWYWVPAAEIDL